MDGMVIRRLDWREHLALGHSVGDEDVVKLLVIIRCTKRLTSRQTVDKALAICAPLGWAPITTAHLPLANSSVRYHIECKIFLSAFRASHSSCPDQEIISGVGVMPVARMTVEYRLVSGISWPGRWTSNVHGYFDSVDGERVIAITVCPRRI